MHTRNRFRADYDFSQLISRSPALADFVKPAPHGRPSIDFADPQAVLALNQALLAEAYGLSWSLPRGALCPPVPGRTDYLHHLADLLSNGDESAIPRGPDVRILDIGSGANCIYPMIGASEYGWSFVATEVDQTAMRWARQIVRVNRSEGRSGARPIAALIEHRLQPDPLAIFAGVTKPGERFAASMCNPPFHASAKEAAAGSARKRKNLELLNPEPLNFGGAANELWCLGGEVGFIERMIADSAALPALCRWFTTLVSRSEHLPRLKKSLKRVGPSDAKTIDMAQGQKKSRILAWTFYRP